MANLKFERSKDTKVSTEHKPYHPTKGFRKVSEKRLAVGWKWPLLWGMFRRFK